MCAALRSPQIVLNVGTRKAFVGVTQVWKNSSRLHWPGIFLARNGPLGVTTHDSIVGLRTIKAASLFCLIWEKSLHFPGVSDYSAWVTLMIFSLWLKPLLGRTKNSLSRKNPDDTLTHMWWLQLHSCICVSIFPRLPVCWTFVVALQLIIAPGWLLGASALFLKDLIQHTTHITVRLCCFFEWVIFC